ncbi:MAG TPA: 8-oxo-dGTP diphosphatase MutT, partial [Steroidobacteraceae bacterium]|nr:8-oxo-dGTP diphosphatase MutT [Steroidobacteraceae bacterium]
MSRAPPIHVVAGVLRDAAGRILLAQRPAGKHLAGDWEFPGGKLEAGETRLHGLYRELQEELGIMARNAHPLIRVRHRYPERRVLLDVWVVTRYRGVPVGRDGQRLRWCRSSALPRAELLAADRPVVAALRLPERLTASETRVYHILPIDDAAWRGPQRADRLRGAWCDGAADAAAAAALDDARFLV